MFFAKIVQTSGMTKEKTKFFFCHSRVQPILFKDSANEWNDKRKDEVFLFHSRVQPILSRDSANEWNGKTLENLLFLRDL